MSDQNPYAKLGVSEDASFDEIQDARRRLLEQHSSDAKTLEMIEAAYDAILMERLRLRQEGKIKVPERIRFPDMKFPSPSRESSAPRQDPFVWLQRVLDRPTAQDIYMPGALYLGLTGTILFFYTAGGDAILQLALVLGAGISVYFLNRKENKFGRCSLVDSIYFSYWFNFRRTSCCLVVTTHTTCVFEQKSVLYCIDFCFNVVG